MSSSTSLVEDVETLIAKWGIDKVRKALDFVSTFPDSVRTISFITNTNSATFTVTYDQLSILRGTYAHGLYKVMAIKKFREMFGTGLMDAKEAIEYLFESGKQY